MSTAMQVRLRHWPGMKVSWLGAGAVVHSGEEPSAGSAALVVSPHGSTECAVVISSHTVKLQPAMIEELAEVLANGLPRGFTAMRFVAWDGACATNERPAAAHMIAMRLGIDVIAAAGPLLGVPGGSLFAPVGRGEQRPGGFWRFRTGTPAVRVGWRFPAPTWESDLCTEMPELPGDLVLDQIPAGLWLHRRRVGSVTDLAYSVPTDPENPAMILGHPGDEPLHRDELARAVTAVPTLAADRCVFTPYGQNPIAEGPVGPVVADVLGRAVHVRTGLPLCAPAGQRAVVTIDNKGLPRWRTFARELWHAPRTGAPRPVDWINPCPDVLGTPAGQATFSLGSGWVLEVVQAGLWVRPEHLNDPADWVRGLPVDVNRCAVLVGAPNAAEIPPPAHTIAEILEKLPIDARKRAYIAVPRGAAPNVFILATGLLESLPEPGEVELVSPATPTNSGSFPAVTPDAPRHATGRHGDANGPFLVDGRPANGHPSGAHPTVSRSAAHEQDYEHGYSSHTGSFPAFSPSDTDRGSLTGSFPAVDADRGSRSGSFPASDPDRGSRTGAFPPVDADRGSRTGAFPPVDADRGSRTGSFPAFPAADAPADRGPRNGSFPPADADRGSRTGSFPAFSPADPPTTSFDAQRMPRNGASPATGAFPAVPESPTGSFAPLTPNGSQRPGRPGGYPAEPPAQQPRPRPGETTGSFPTAAFRNGTPDATAPMVPIVPGPSAPANGHGHGPAPMNGHGPAPVNGHGPAPVNGHGHGPGPAPANGHGPGGTYGAAPQAPNGFHGNGQYNGFNGAAPAPAHPDLHVAPPRAFHREDQPLHPSGPGAPHGYSFDAPDYDEHHFDPVTPPTRHHEDPTGRMPAQRAPRPDEQADPADDTSSTNTGREIRSHNKKGKVQRADDKTSTQELDRLLGFFDEIRRAKAWDEDPSSPDQQAAKRAAAGQPPAGPRRARH
ncbi:hypothetical protein ACPPVO_11805 [Dactylosporangium sp. McL0621]|uniref:hypothetical protein n=1 Tax=Dactylosporangium sp. McL0621 TaxID=3415678 RepID=UPI003CF68E1F